MLDFRKIASEIQHKIAILLEIEIGRKSATKIAKNRGATEIQRKISSYKVEISELKSDIEIGH